MHPCLNGIQVFAACINTVKHDLYIQTKVYILTSDKYQDYNHKKEQKKHISRTLTHIVPSLP